MANKRTIPGCVEIKICADDYMDREIVKFQYAEKAKSGKKNYNKPEAAFDLFMKLLREKAQ